MHLRSLLFHVKRRVSSKGNLMASTAMGNRSDLTLVHWSDTGQRALACVLTTRAFHAAQRSLFITVDVCELRFERNDDAIQHC
jgi:hypothetical protein